MTLMLMISCNVGSERDFSSFPSGVGGLFTEALLKRKNKKKEKIQRNRNAHIHRGLDRTTQEEEEEEEEEEFCKRKKHYLHGEEKQGICFSSLRTHTYIYVLRI